MAETPGRPDTAGPPLTTNLADARLGAVGVWCTDEFFAPLSRMLEPAEPVFIPDKYDDHGKWMDGWESRRRRGGGHDRSVVRLAAPGEVHAVDIDTRHFTGNYPPAASLEACLSDGDPGDGADWVTLVPPAALGPNAHHLFPVADRRTWSHVRLTLLPDGGVARLRVYGRAAAGLDRAGGARRARSGLGRARRRGDRLERRPLRQSRQHAAARSRARHGRRLGDSTPPRARPRLVHHRPGASRHHRPRGGRHRPLQGQLPRPLLPAGGVAARRTRANCAPRWWRSRCSGRCCWTSSPCRRTASTPLRPAP